MPLGLEKKENIQGYSPSIVPDEFLQQGEKFVRVTKARLKQIYPA